MLTLRRIHYAADGSVISDEVLKIPTNTRVGQLFTQSDSMLSVARFMRNDGEEIVWERI